MIGASRGATRAIAAAIRPERDVKLLRRRRVDDAEDRHAVPHQRDVDGELAALLDELARAVERIDEEEFGTDRRHSAQPRPPLRR